jgi:hypothetical protein
LLPLTGSASSSAAAQNTPTATTASSSSVICGKGSAAEDCRALRRRLRQKKSVLHILCWSAHALLLHVSSFFDATSAFANVTDAQRRVVFEFLRQHFVKTFVADSLRSAAFQRRSYRDRRATARAAFAELQPQARADIMEALLCDGTMPGHMRVAAERLSAEWTAATPLVRDTAGVRRQSLLLTWNGPWGVLRGTSVPPPGTDLNVAVEQLRQHVAVQRLWSEALQLSERASRALRLDKYAVSLEVCTQSFHDGTLRVHAHALWACNTQLRLRSLGAWRFGGSLPHRCLDGLSARARGRQTHVAVHAGIYYLLAPKRGQLFCHSTVRPFHDFPVSPDWVNTLWATSKLGPEEAVQELVRCKRDVARHVHNVREQVLQERALALQSELAALRSMLASSKSARRHVHEVDEVWLPEQRVPGLRQRFLVLDGPSRLGKTEFAKALCGEGATLELTCTGEDAAEPNLKAFVRGQHKAVLFDECGVQTVLSNRKLFQAPACVLQLAQSRTHCHAYEVCLHGVLLIICSNSWAAQLAALALHDRDWLQQNSVHVRVTEPLWDMGADTGAPGKNDPTASGHVCGATQSLAGCAL